jgi:hypothetical protein
MSASGTSRRVDLPEECLLFGMTGPSATEGRCLPLTQIGIGHGDKSLGLSSEGQMELGRYRRFERLAPTRRYDTLPQAMFMDCQLDAYAAVCSARRPI